MNLEGVNIVRCVYCIDHPNPQNLSGFCVLWRNVFTAQQEATCSRPGIATRPGRMPFPPPSECCKDVSRRAHERIGAHFSPCEVEEVLRRHPAVADLLAFAFEHPAHGESVAIAFIHKRQAKGREPTLEDFRAFGQALLSSCILPRAVVCVDGWPSG